MQIIDIWILINCYYSNQKRKSSEYYQRTNITVLVYWTVRIPETRHDVTTSTKYIRIYQYCQYQDLQSTWIEMPVIVEVTGRTQPGEGWGPTRWHPPSRLGKGGRKKSNFLVDSPLRPLAPPPSRLSGQKNGYK